jgi:hypothetical protein
MAVAAEAVASGVITAGVVKAGTLISAGTAKAADALNSGLAWTTARLGDRGGSAITNLATNATFNLMSDYLEGKRSSLRDWEITIATSLFYGYALNPASVAEFNVNQSSLKRAVEEKYGGLKYAP